MSITFHDAAFTNEVVKQKLLDEITNIVSLDSTALNVSQVVFMLAPWSKLVTDRYTGQTSIFIDLPDLCRETGAHIIPQLTIRAALARIKQLHSHLFRQCDG